MPSSDYGSRAGTSASNPSSRSYGGSGGGGVGGNRSNDRGGLGLSTGKTMFGNTAFGPAGGSVQGYATNTRAPSGMGPSIGSFSDFRTPSGAPMFGGGLQNRAISARSPQQALGMLQALQAAQAMPRPSGGRVGGLLDGEQVTVGPTTIEPAGVALPGSLGVLRYASPAFPGAYTPEQLSQFRAQQSSWGMRNPTQRPYDRAASPMTLGRAGTISGGPPPQPANPTWDRFTNSIGGWMGNGMTYKGN